MLTHSREKPYTREMCLKQYALSSNFKKHLHVHTSDEAFSCEICKTVFSVTSFNTPYVDAY